VGTANLVEAGSRKEAVRCLPKLGVGAASGWGASGEHHLRVERSEGGVGDSRSRDAAQGARDRGELETVKTREVRECDA
jgi:hypothetical protein